MMFVGLAVIDSNLGDSLKWSLGPLSGVSSPAWTQNIFRLGWVSDGLGCPKVEPDYMVFTWHWAPLIIPDEYCLQ